MKNLRVLCFDCYTQIVPGAQTEVIPPTDEQLKELGFYKANNYEQEED